MHLTARKGGGKRGEDVKTFGEKALKTIHIKGKEVLGACGYRDCF